MQNETSQAALERSSQDAYDIIRLTRSKAAVWTVGMVELCAKNLQIMRNDFKDYARTLPIMRTFHVKS